MIEEFWKVVRFEGDKLIFVSDIKRTKDSAIAQSVSDTIVKNRVSVCEYVYIALPISEIEKYYADGY